MKDELRIAVPAVLSENRDVMPAKLMDCVG
jgi:hypothetical protein